MRDTEPMPTIKTRAEPPAAPAAPRPAGGAWRTMAGVAAMLALAAILACAYLRGEVVALQGELHVSRLAARQAIQAADRASLDAENARTALANVEPTDPPAPPDADPSGNANPGD